MGLLSVNAFMAWQAFEPYQPARSLTAALSLPPDYCRFYLRSDRLAPPEKKGCFKIVITFQDLLNVRCPSFDVDPAIDLCPVHGQSVSAKIISNAVAASVITSRALLRPLA